MAWVYILECADGSYYAGSTTDLDRRLWEHNEGLGAAYTRRRRPVTLVWSTHYDRIDRAYAFEKQIQNWSRAKRKALIDGRIDDLRFLSSRSTSAAEVRAVEDPVVPPTPQVREAFVMPPPPEHDDDPWAPPDDGRVS